MLVSFKHAYKLKYIIMNLELMQHIELEDTYSANSYLLNVIVLLKK